MSRINFDVFSLLLLRLVIGGRFLLAGLGKMLVPGWSSADFLKDSTGVFAPFFSNFSGNQTIDVLVIWGEFLGGLALIFGLGTRLASIGLALLMLMIYLANFPSGELISEEGLIDEHIVMIAALIAIVGLRAGAYFGLASYITRYLPRFLAVLIE